ncbi:MAG: N-acetylneuraminate synthase family protein [Chloroflexota bacterium]
MTLPVLFLVPARGGSIRVPAKNLRTVAGIPLVAHGARIARAAAARTPGGPHAVVCSTDDPAIADVAREWHAEVPFERPAALAGPEASSVDVALHALEVLAARGRRFRALVLVQPTAPLADPADVAGAVAALDADGAPVTSVVPAHPAAWHVALDEGLRLRPVGDDARFLLAGAFYAITPLELATARRFVIPGRTRGLEVRARTAVDIDTEDDLAVARALAAARPVPAVALAGRSIGDGRCFLVAEGGVNHNGDPTLAHRLIDAAADAGAEAVKFQTFDPLLLAAVDAPMADYQRAAGEGATDQRSMLARLALPVEAWSGLRDHAVDRGLIFLSSPFDEASADLLEALGIAAFKVPSGELTNLPFLERLAAVGRPLLVSTGMATMAEVADALDAIAAGGDPPVALLHCVSAYPADPAEANLRSIATLRAAFGRPSGWSDHTLGIELPTAAAAMGADLLEKHLTLDRSLPGPDHRASLEPAEMAALVRAVRTIEAARGDGEKAPSAAELAVAAVARKSLHWARALPAGAAVKAADLVALRPGTGLQPGLRDAIVGRPTMRPVRAGGQVTLADVEADEEAPG